MLLRICQTPTSDGIIKELAKISLKNPRPKNAKFVRYCS